MTSDRHGSGGSKLDSSQDDILTALERLKSGNRINEVNRPITAEVEGASPSPVNESAPYEEEENDRVSVDFLGTTDGVCERPGRYANPTRTIPLATESIRKPRVVSNSNLVGAPPPNTQSGQYKLQNYGNSLIGNSSKGKWRDPVVAVIILIVMLVVIILLATLPFIITNEREAERVMPLQLIGSKSNDKANSVSESTIDQKDSETTTVSRWLIEIAVVDKYSEYEQLFKLLEKDGFNPTVRVENQEGVDIFRIEMVESDTEKALSIMSTLKRLKYIDPTKLKMNPLKNKTGE
jgi:hypothetical protein